MSYVFIVGLFLLVCICTFLHYGSIVLGESKEGVQCFSNIVSNIVSILGFNNGEKNYLYNNNKLFKLFTGLKWECVEFVRRYFILVKGLTFVSVDNALQLTNLTNFVNIHTQLPVPITHNRNGKCVVEKHDILVIKNSSPFGHVAIVSNVDKDKNIVEIVEQNYNNYWLWYGSYSRQFELRGGRIVVPNGTIIDIIKVL